MKKNKVILILILFIIIFIYYIFSNNFMKHFMIVICSKNDSKYLYDTNAMSNFNDNENLEILNIIVYNHTNTLYFLDKSDWETFFITYKDVNNRIIIKEYNGYEGSNSPLLKFVIENNDIIKFKNINNSICFISLFILYIYVFIFFLSKFYFKYLKTNKL